MRRTSCRLTEYFACCLLEGSDCSCIGKVEINDIGRVVEWRKERKSQVEAKALHVGRGLRKPGKKSGPYDLHNLPDSNTCQTLGDPFQCMISLFGTHRLDDIFIRQGVDVPE